MTAVDETSGEACKGSLHAMFPKMRRRARAARARGLPGLTTGFPLLDEAIGGWRGLGVIGGNPGARKSTLLHTCGCKVVELNNAWFVHLTYEMPADAIVALSAAIHSGTEQRQVESGYLETDEGADALTQASQWIERYGPRVHIWGSSTVADVDALVRRVAALQAALGVKRGLVVVDCVQRMAARCTRRSEKEAIDDTLEQLHALAHGMGIAVVATSHVTKKGGAGDLAFPFAGSGGIDHLADFTGTLVTQPEVGPPSKKRSGPVRALRSELLIRKNRFGRENSKIPFKLFPGRTLFEETV